MNANGAFWACGVGGIDRRVRPIPRVAVLHPDLRGLVRRAMFPTLFSDKGERVSQALDVGIEAVMRNLNFLPTCQCFQRVGQSLLTLAWPHRRREPESREYCE